MLPQLAYHCQPTLRSRNISDPGHLDLGTRYQIPNYWYQTGFKATVFCYLFTINWHSWCNLKVINFNFLGDAVYHHTNLTHSIPVHLLSLSLANTFQSVNANFYDCSTDLSSTCFRCVFAHRCASWVYCLLSESIVVVCNLVLLTIVCWVG